jgi:hypothetical protein
MLNLAFGNPVVLLPVLGGCEVLQIPRDMKAGYWTTVNETLQRNDVVNLHAFRAVGVNVKQVFFRDPCGRSAFNVFPSVIKPSGVVGISCPAMPTGRVEFFRSFLVRGFFLLRNFLSVLFISLIALFSPFILIIAVFTEILFTALTTVSERTRLTPMTNGAAFFIELRTRLFNLARRTNLACKRFGARFHNSDIIATEGDLKQGEFGGR